MKYVMTWKKKRHDTRAEYETGRQRMLAQMRGLRCPDAVRIHQFVVRTGDTGGGYVVFETEDLAQVHAATEAFAGLNFHIDPVIDLDEALAAAGVAMEWRDSAV